MPAGAGQAVVAPPVLLGGGDRDFNVSLRISVIRRTSINLNPAVGLETGTGFAAACNQGERLKPVRGAAADRAGGPLGSVSALRSGCDTTVAPGPTAPQFLATAPGSRQSVGRRGVPCVGRRACC